MTGRPSSVLCVCVNSLFLPASLTTGRNVPKQHRTHLFLSMEVPCQNHLNCQCADVRQMTDVRSSCVDEMDPHVCLSVAHASAPYGNMDSNASSAQGAVTCK